MDDRLRKRTEFDDLFQNFEEDKGHITLPARIAISALTSFVHAENVTAKLGADHRRRVAAAQATQAPKGPPGMPGDAARVLYPPPHQGGPGTPGPPYQPDFPMGTSRGGSGGQDAPAGQPPPGGGPPGPGADGAAIAAILSATATAPSGPSGPSSSSSSGAVLQGMDVDYYGGPPPTPPGGVGAIAA